MRRRRGSTRKLRVTREGRVFILATLGVGAAAVNTGNNLMYLVLGLLLSLIVLSGVLSELVLRGVSVRRSLPRRAFANKVCLIELELENQKSRAPSYSIELEDQREPGHGEVEGRCYFLKVAPGDRQLRAYRFWPSRRGRTRLSGVIVRTRYPFGLFEKWRVLPLGDELLVYPELASGSAEPPAVRTMGRDAQARRPGVGTEVAGLREYRDGDEARSIHWRRTASLGRLVVRERSLDTTKRITMHINEVRPVGADAGWDARFESTLSRVAMAATRALDAGAAVDAVSATERSPLVLPGRPPDPIWRFLALLEARAPDTPLGEPALPQQTDAAHAADVRSFQVVDR